LWGCSLSLAAERGYKEVMEMLLARYDIDMNPRDACKKTPLSLAAEGGYEEVVGMLLARDDVDVNSRDEPQ